MNKLYLSSVLLAIFALPAFADINKNASTATCDSDTIGATSGNAYMDTDWTANTINLDFYSDGEKISTGSCTYDGAIELPEDPEDKTGYTFGGWQLRRAPAAPAQTTFDLSTLAQYININGKGTGFSRLNGNVGEDELTYGLTQGSGEWATQFEYGTIKGIARCSVVGSGYTVGQIGVPSDDLDMNNLSNGASYCWCKAIGFDADKDGSYTPVAPSSWFFLRDSYGSADHCAGTCGTSCATGVNFNNNDFRVAMYGITQ